MSAELFSRYPDLLAPSLADPERRVAVNSATPTLRLADTLREVTLSDPRPPLEFALWPAGSNPVGGSRSPPTLDETFGGPLPAPNALGTNFEGAITGLASAFEVFARQLLRYQGQQLQRGEAGLVIECAASSGQSVRRTGSAPREVPHFQSEVVLLQHVVEVPEFGHRRARPRHRALRTSRFGFDRCVKSHLPVETQLSRRYIEPRLYNSFFRSNESRSCPAESAAVRFCRGH
jgi:hypothetical protein